MGGEVELRLTMKKQIPIRRHEVKPLGWKRELRTDFVTPRLNERRERTEAIGFWVNPEVDDYYEQDRKR